MNEQLYADLDRVCELLEQAKSDLHYWQGEKGIQELRHDLTELMLKITLLQERI